MDEESFPSTTVLAERTVRPAKPVKPAKIIERELRSNLTVESQAGVTDME
jgi:hypothetical protein